MKPISRQFRDFFVSLKLTVILLSLSIILIFCATLAQVNLGVWGVQEKYFHAFFVMEKLPGSNFRFPVFLGGYLLGGLLLLNLIAAHIYRFKLEWKKTGIQLTHLGVILLLVGELLTGLFQQESQMRLEEGETKNYSESYRDVELAVLDTTDPKFNAVVAIPQAVLVDGGTIQHPKLPFQVRIRDYYPNAALQMRDQVPNVASAVATQGIGPRVALTPLPLTYKTDERNEPAADIEIIGTEGSQGIWLVSSLLAGGMPQTFTYQGRTWELSLRFKRYYRPFSLTLIKFTHEVYAGTDIPKNFASRVRLQSGESHEDREILIYMNNPLRYSGLTFYQASYEGEHTTILQVVRNPSWVLPYVSCILMALGLITQFGIHLVGFIRKRSQKI